MSKKLYHATRTENLIKIKTKGILPQSKSHVICLSDTKKFACNIMKWKNLKDSMSNYRLLSINMKHLNKDKLNIVEKGDYPDASCEYRYKDTIPPFVIFLETDSCDEVLNN